MTPRSYTMSARADAADATRDRILDATIALALDRQALDFSLEQVAERSERSVQTILRRFGSRDGLLEVAIERGSAQVAADRRPPAPGDIPGALALLVERYERWGQFMLRLLAYEGGRDDADQDAATVTATGRLLHRRWVTEVFEPHGAELTDLLVVATDLYTWKLLRLDRGLSPHQTRQRIAALTDAVLSAYAPHSTETAAR
ncbi:MAG TPA: TetR/AcrR family transcriptional regulator [Conexibacter sp.]|jgi:AcrR family transcriptional regulator